MKQEYKLASGFLLTAFAGGILGFLVQACAARAGGWYGGDPAAAFGLVSYGLFFWITICTLRAYHSRCGLHASLLVLSLLIPVLCGYYLGARLLYNPLNEYVLRLGILMLLPSAAAAWVLRATYRHPLSRLSVRCIGTAALLLDIGSRIHFNPLPLLAEIALFAWFMYITRDLGTEYRKRSAFACCTY